MSETFEMVAKTFQGLEGVLSDELVALGAHEVKQGRRMVSFKGDKEMMYRANFALRTALRVLKPFYKFTSTDADDLYEQVKQFHWEDIMSEGNTFAIDCTVNSDTFRHSRFVTYRVKDGIADYFMERCGKRPSIRLNSADYQVNVHINGKEVGGTQPRYVSEKAIETQGGSVSIVHPKNYAAMKDNHLHNTLLKSMKRG